MSGSQPSDGTRSSTLNQGSRWSSLGQWRFEPLFSILWQLKSSSQQLEAFATARRSKFHQRSHHRSRDALPRATTTFCQNFATHIQF
ncbi:hypothetical protein O6P43_032446 [Quillaja saponaria]|uniref:Uncharacterized protein n=1 Tax=Quillaja saponaria TaxID=32244 RepID=A0AAD7P5Q0_QUISA|nr:hypothetical protein O6P43_032446 [Quillaja saponaria]